MLVNRGAANLDGMLFRGTQDGRVLAYDFKASVFSPLIAAKASFALKAGAWFRRGRLLIVSPAPRPFLPRSGRNSTYAAVQISQATSLDEHAR